MALTAVPLTYNSAIAALLEPTVCTRDLTSAFLTFIGLDISMLAKSLAFTSHRYLNSGV